MRNEDFEKHRNKALACEKLGTEAKDHDIKCAWAEIAIEWHPSPTELIKKLVKMGEVSLKAP